jgi:hypothetical protein
LCLWAPPPENTGTLTASARPRAGAVYFLGVPGDDLAYRTICLRAQSALQSRMLAARRQKITLAEMRASGVRGLLIYCSDYHCSHWTAISGDRWPDDVRLSDLSRGLAVRRAAGVARRCGRIGNRLKRMRDKGWRRRAATF